ncbi:MAG: amino acid ABC transporter substrate-binding protein [Fretibacterium sp.]|nr:amino acid ABC transporter substrate-binding protein [Fretibacterium sp.]
MNVLKKAIGVVLLVFLVCLTCLGAGSPSWADDALKSVQDRGTLVVGFCAAYPPFESRNELTGEFEGFDVDLARALAEKLGVKVEFRDTEWPGLIAGVNKGDFDVLLSCMSKSETRGENVDMTDIYYLLSDVAVVRTGDERFKSTEDLKDKVVGVQMGSAAEQVADKLEGLKEIRRFNYNPEAFLDLQHKRIDALIVGYAYAVNQIKTTSGEFHVLGEVGDPSEIVMVLKKDSSLTEPLNAALKELRGSGKYDEILKKWLAVE